MENHPPGPTQPHLPVLFEEVLALLTPKDSEKYLDCTVGAGGHAAGILEASSPSGELLGLDVDLIALDYAKNRLNNYGSRAKLIHGSYIELDRFMREASWNQVHGILMDLGLSSMQLDMPEKGFSFRADAPLDMRFDARTPLSAADLLNSYTEEDLLDILWKYGEEQQTRRIVREIIRQRPVTSTLQLASLIEKAVGHSRGGIHPATKTFQALRIAVNGELEHLEEALPLAVNALQPGGRLAVISFHSLEDRIVKHYFQLESKDCICPPKRPVCTCGHQASIRIITRRPVEASQAEMNQNPRARSAKLRVAERISSGMSVAKL